MPALFQKFRMTSWVLLLGLASVVGVRADGGWVCFQQSKTPYKVTVFADPAPLRAGPVDFSVLVQDLESGRTVTDAEILLSVSPTFDIQTSKDGEWLPPCCRLEANTLEGKAGLGAGGNGLLYELRTSLSQPGQWQLDVSVLKNGRTTMVGGTIQVEKAVPPWFVYWPYLTAPLFGVVFLVLNSLARRDRKSVRVLAGAEAI